MESVETREVIDSRRDAWESCVWLNEVRWVSAEKWGAGRRREGGTDRGGEG